MTDTLNLKVIEMLHYVTDVDKSLEFYNCKLGWPIIWQSPGNMAMIDAGGVYQLTIVSTKLVTGWEAGMPVPPPKLAFESRSLNTDAVILRERGLADLEVSGDPTDMLFTNFIDPEGINIMIWQDTGDAPAAQVVDQYKAARAVEPIYKLGECILFVNDLNASRDFYTSTFGFEVHEQHGDKFYGMRLNDGPVVGLYNWSGWWDKPVGEITGNRVRLFFECPDIASEHSRHEESGIIPGEHKTSDDGLNWFSIDDPDGNTMTFWQFKPDENQKPL